jgi:hypothetical protein
MKYGLFGKVNVSCEEEEIYIVANEAITPQNHVLRLPLFMFPPPHPSLKETPPGGVSYDQVAGGSSYRSL